MANVQFKVHHAVSHKPLGTVTPTKYQFGDPLREPGAIDMTVAVPRSRSAALELQRITDPDYAAVYCVWDGQYVWGGPITYSNSPPGSLDYQIKGQQWEGWLYDRLFSNGYKRLAYDEYKHAYDMVAFAVSEPGCPVIVRPTALGGVARDVTLNPFNSVGQGLDHIAQRDGAFEWSIGIRPHSVTGLPELLLELWEPGQVRATSQLVSLDKRDSRNRVSIGDWPNDATGRRPRVWATGEGQPPDQPIAKDQDPDLAVGAVLLRETVSNWPGVIKPITLFDHARRERLIRELGASTIPVNIPVDAPSIAQYRTGDRARLQVYDYLRDIDISGVRIINRSVTKAEGKLPIATLVLDLHDVEVP